MWEKSNIIYSLLCTPSPVFKTILTTVDSLLKSLFFNQPVLSGNELCLLILCENTFHLSNTSQDVAQLVLGTPYLLNGKLNFEMVSRTQLGQRTMGDCKKGQILSWYDFTEHKQRLLNTNLWWSYNMQCVSLLENNIKLNMGIQQKTEAY